MCPAFAVTVPINENGIILDPGVPSTVGEVLGAPRPVSDVVVYSHGWWANAADADQQYNAFSVGFERCLMDHVSWPGLTLPTEAFAAAVQWPSLIPGKPGPIEDVREALTFYTMGKRADIVGEHGVASLVRLLYASKRRPLRLSMIGHSYGCRVVCSALVSALAQLPAIDPTIRIRVALLEAAFNRVALAPGGAYAQLSTYPGVDLRLLVTTSKLDTALVTWYPEAERLANLFSGGDMQALGAAGPDPATETVWGGRGDVTVGSGFDASGISAQGERLVVADLTPLHKSHPDGDAGPFMGHHSDIYLVEVYRLLAGFLFRT